MAQESFQEKSRFASPEEELRFLREQIAHKEQELERSKKEVQIENLIKEEVSSYAKQKPEEILSPSHRATDEEIKSITLNLSPETHDDTMGELLGILNEKGLRNTLSVIERMENPHLEDDFHRFIVQYIKEGYPAEGLKEKGPLWNVLHMTLYEIALPEAKKEESPPKPLKELLSSMEQFYAGMLSASSLLPTLTQCFTMEIAVADGSNEIILFAAVPDSKRDLFEKQIFSIFPKAEIREQKNDYNIFVDRGISVGSYATLYRKHILPIKTYEQFDYDPAHIILNAFSKIEKEGGGAALQVVFSPAKDIFTYKYQEALLKIQKGVSPSEALNIPLSAGGELLRATKNIFFPFKPRKKDGALPIVDQILVDNIKTKIGSPMARVNIRLLASAKSENRAENILSELEAAFGQFENAAGNKFSFKRLSKKKTEMMFEDFSFRKFSSDYPLVLNTKELATVMHVPQDGAAYSHQFKRSKTHIAPAPLGMPEEGTLLGVNAYRDAETKIYLTKEDRLRHFYIIGQTGTGKSTLLKNMIVQDIQAGEGVCMIDPHGADLVDILGGIPEERFKDVIYFDPGYTPRVMGLNMLEYDERYPEQKTFVVNELLSIFRKLFGAVPESMGPAFEQYFRNSALLVMEHPESGNTLLDVGRILSDSSFRKRKLLYNKNPVIAQFWANAERTTGEQSLANFAQYVTNKFDVFLSNEIMRPIIAQEKSTFDFRKIMDERKILLVNLSKGRLGEINSNLIGLVLVGKILMAALSRGESAYESAPFYLYIDEFQNVTTDSIAVILSEARKYKLSLTVAHQFIAQLDERIKDAVFGNVGSIAAFRVGAQDAEYLEKQFQPVFTSHDLLNLDNLSACARLLSRGRPVKPFTIQIPLFPRADAHKVNTIKELSYSAYGKPREEVETDIKKRYDTAS